MAGPFTLRGESVSVALTINNEVQGSLDSVKSFEFTYEQEIKKEGYLGERTDRRDSVFTGVTGKIMLHVSNAATFDTLQKIVDRSQNRDPNVSINIRATVSFPDGSNVRMLFAEPAFGSIPFSAGSRTEKISLELPFECENVQRIG